MCHTTAISSRVSDPVTRGNCHANHSSPSLLLLVLSVLFVLSVLLALGEEGERKRMRSSAQLGLLENFSKYRRAAEVRAVREETRPEGRGATNQV